MRGIEILVLYQGNITSLKAPEFLLENQSVFLPVKNKKI